MTRKLTYTSVVTKAADRGRQAARDGLPASACPYPETVVRCAWVARKDPRRIWTQAYDAELCRLHTEENQ